MISGVTHNVGDASETFRMTTRAMMAIEQALGTGIVEALEGLQNGFRVSLVATLIAECANDGKGRDMAWAQGALDTIGLTSAAELLAEVAEAAFPDAKGDEGNAKRATGK